MTNSDNLTAPDALRQVLDIVDLLSKAEANQDFEEKIVWRLLSASANSPFAVELVATATAPDISIALQALRVKQIVREAVSSLLETGGHAAEWMDNTAHRTIKNILNRNMNGIGRTDIDFKTSDDPVIIVHASAKRALLALERSEIDSALSEEDLTHVEYGAVEGEVIATGLHHSRPSIFLRERLTGERVVCVLATEIAEKIGPEHSWLEVWTGRRTLVFGAVYYDQEGVIRRINAENIETFVVPDVAFDDIRDPDFTGGLSPADFLNHAWGDDRGQN